jgi:hypothetical protein
MKSITTFSIALLFSVCIYAQDWSFAVFKYKSVYPGYYISAKGDTVKGFLQYGDKVDNQTKCVFYDSDQKTNRQTFSPDDIKGFCVGDKVYRSIHYSGGLLSKPLRFVLIKTDGPITEFIFYPEYGLASGDDKTVFYKANDPNNTDVRELQYFGMGFAKKMAAFVSDDSELSEKVANKEKGYGLLKTQDIIDEYNKWYLAQHK